MTFLASFGIIIYQIRRWIFTFWLINIVERISLNECLIKCKVALLGWGSGSNMTSLASCKISTPRIISGGSYACQDYSYLCPEVFLLSFAKSYLRFVIKRTTLTPNKVAKVRMKNIRSCLAVIRTGMFSIRRSVDFGDLSLFFWRKTSMASSIGFNNLESFGSTYPARPSKKGVPTEINRPE